MKPSDAYLTLDRMTVLIVDDNAPLRGILRTILNALGAARIYEAGDVRAAMDVLQHEHVDLLICDWKMKPVDGLALVRWVRNPATSPCPTLPILLLTCYADVERVQIARDAGVNEFMVKPFSPESIYQHISSIFRKPRRFVDSKSFFGPDRRCKVVTPASDDRRVGNGVKN
ncbi:response regulator [Oceanicaulis sp. LC35]|uniref:response regulator n=1 Tax=Oceanicaulis sp. LC35 TaxID=3349635 RepID=UPI003F87800E